MEPLLIYVIVLLTVAICALGGFWFYRADQARRKIATSPHVARRSARDDCWEGAVRATRDRI